MTTFALKIIASLCMLIDHVGEMFPLPWGFRQALRLIGRIAFPIYAYLIAQGCKHTKDINKYLIRLGIFALISEIPFDIAFMSYARDGALTLNINFMEGTNVFYTLFLGVASIIVYEKLKQKKRPWVFLILLFATAVIPFSAILLTHAKNGKLVMLVAMSLYLAVALWLCHSLPERETDADVKLSRKLLAVIATIPILCLGNLMDTDYGMMGVIYILFLYLMKPEDRITRTIAMFSVVFFKYAYPFIYTRLDEVGISLFMLPGGIVGSDNLYDFCFALIAVALVCLYRGRQGPRAKWPFYIFYPAHIAVLAVICLLFVTHTFF